jgi:hypothetical protein
MEEEYRIVLRLPTDLATKLAKLAEKERRSINSELIALIEEKVR